MEEVETLIMVMVLVIQAMLYMGDGSMMIIMKVMAVALKRVGI